MLCVYFLLALIDSVRCYSSGKVSVACGNMVPQHGYKPRQDSPPYRFSLDKSTFSPGDRITVSLQTASSRPIFFRGFLIEARDAANLNSPAVGFFKLTDSHEARLLTCDHTQGSALSHKGSSRKTYIQAVWVSPQNPPPVVQFLVTVVQEYKVYWVWTADPVVSLRGATPCLPTVAPAETTTALSSPFSSVGCGHSKSCLRDPVDCHPESDPHCFFLSFTTDGSGHSGMFELSGPAEGYLSFALSLDKWMGNDDMYLCINNGGRVTISAAYSSGRTYPELEAEDNLWGQTSRMAEGVIQCRFHRNSILPNRFNLNQSYYIFLAHGRSHQGFIHRHERQPLISSSQKVITGFPEDLRGSRSPLLIKIHGVLMLTAWMWTVNTAVFIARHYKQLDAILLGQRLWFQLHRTMMVLSVVLTGVAFILPFIYRRGWSKSAGSHPYIGCAVITLSVIQAGMAVLRPSPRSSRRIIFTRMHLAVGTITQILAVVCVFLAFNQQLLLLPSPWSPAVLAGWLLWILLADLLLLIHTYRIRSKGSSDTDETDIIMMERQQREEIAKVQKMVLLVFLIGNTAFWAAFVNFIANV
ncbi:putative ferric-chelate reductase 1 isoform X2 [Melanotaenia boesemani]|uniref:putative ferric-chelate reductase 1 isoform X2 n=1 Tax=Melanotaenia boesemani TaxID=1250792 RepID=UPI001C04A636|nr:putative ferric-chelate reductase 1 isoform X2 [Melanotaenia boesemani]